MPSGRAFIAVKVLFTSAKVMFFAENKIYLCKVFGLLIIITKFGSLFNTKKL